MIEVKEAIKIIKSNLKPKDDIKTINIINSINRVSAQDIYSPIDSPPFDRSPYDGYAYDANINGNELVVVGEVYAGDVYEGVLHKNESVKIMTGAKIPNGANCVIKKEDVSIISEDKIIVNKELKVYDNYIFKGEDIPKDQLVIRKGDVISYEYIGILASLGIKEINVYDNLKIGILNTGTEIQDLEEILKDGKIYDSNRYILHSKLLKRNIEPSIIDKVEDEIEELESKIKNILKDVDILITTGGVSVGDKDLVPQAFKNVGGKELFWKVKAKPGGACCASVVDEKLLFGLSGSPHASGMVYANILIPVIEYMSHKENDNSIKAIFRGTFNKKAKIDRYLNGRLYTEDAKLYVAMTDKNDVKARLWSTLNSNCLIKVKGGNILEDEQLVEVIII